MCCDAACLAPLAAQRAQLAQRASLATSLQCRARLERPPPLALPCVPRVLRDTRAATPRCRRRRVPMAPTPRAQRRRARRAHPALRVSTRRCRRSRAHQDSTPSALPPRARAVQRATFVRGQQTTSSCRVPRACTGAFCILSAFLFFSNSPGGRPTRPVGNHCRGALLSIALLLMYRCHVSAWRARRSAQRVQRGRRARLRPPPRPTPARR